MIEVAFSSAFIAGFEHAAECVGMEGDYRHADWSAPYQFLKEKLATLPLDVEGERARLRREIDERLAQLAQLNSTNRG